MRKIAIAVAAALCLSACATLGALGALVRPLRIEAAGDRPAELRLGGRLGLPDAATVRLWARVENPNTFGLTLSAIEGTLYLEESRAAAVEFPLGLPLEPRTEQVIPLDVSVRFADLPGLAGALGHAIGGAPLGYRLEGRITLDAGALGTPTFGPSTLLRGEVRALR